MGIAGTMGYMTIEGIVAAISVPAAKSCGTLETPSSPARSPSATVDAAGLTIGRYLPILSSMRRRAGVLLPIELSILEAAIELRVRGAKYFHGFMMAKELQERNGARMLTAHGTLYKALDRLRKLEFLESEWEDPVAAAAEGRPRRRFYSVTAAGEAALAKSMESPRIPYPAQKKGLASP